MANGTSSFNEAAKHQDNSSVEALMSSALRRLRALKRREFRATRKSRANQHQPLKPAHIYLEDCGNKNYKALQSFSRHGGPDIRDLSGCQKAADHMSNQMRSRQPSSTIRTSPSHGLSGTKATTSVGTIISLSPYSRFFQQLLVDSSIFPPHHEHPDGTAAPEPVNLDYITERLARRRTDLLNFSKEQHQAFVRQDAKAAKEELVRRNVIPIIQGPVEDPATAAGEILFTNLTAFITDEHVVSSKPDFYHGARPEQLKRPIRTDLNHLIVPSTQHDLPILPNHFTVVKGPDGSVAVAKRQATYEAYLGARGIHVLQNYGQAEPLFDNKAYTFALIYHTSVLSLFVCHPVQPVNSGEQPFYYMTFVTQFAMISNAEAWKEGATWYRNSIDLAKQWRDELIRAANNACRQAGSRKKRKNRGDSADAARIPLPTQEDASQSSPAAKRPKVQRKRRGKEAV